MSANDDEAEVNLIRELDRPLMLQEIADWRDKGEVK